VGGSNDDDLFSENVIAGIILVNTILQVEIIIFCH
jgi:hypothetical protein